MAHELLLGLALMLAAGLGGAFAARLARQPLLVGYLVAGLVVGPSGLGLLRDTAAISALGEMGVALLMFALGVELSVRALGRTKRAAAIAAPVQIALSFGLGCWLATGFGWRLGPGIVLGMVFALSSTMVVVKLLSERGELHTVHGRVMVAVLLVQDLVAVVFVGMLPLVANLQNYRTEMLLGLVLKGAAFVLGVLVVARWVMPWVLEQVARSYSKELFVALATTLCFAGAVTSYELGFSLALGAFVAGLMLGESYYSHEVLANVTPLRDAFGLVFFVVVGMLFDVRLVAGQLSLVGALVAGTLVGKALATLAALLLARYHLRTALIAALGMAQIGEFSFILVTLARSHGLVSSEFHSLVMACTGVTMMLTPLLLRLGEIVYMRLRLPGADLASLAAQARLPGEEELQGHAIICGYGRVGRNISDAFREAGVDFVVIDYDKSAVDDLSARGLRAVYGDAASGNVLAYAGARQARLAVVALPDPISTRLAVREFKRLNPGLSVLARVHITEEIERAYQEGAEEVVQAEFEASLELIRHSLLVLGMTHAEADRRVDRMRRQRYRALQLPEAPGS